MIAKNICRISYSCSRSGKRAKWTSFSDPIETRVKTPPEVNSMNYLVISGRISRAPEWYKEDGKDSFSFRNQDYLLQNEKGNYHRERDR